MTLYHIVELAGYFSHHPVTQNDMVQSVIVFWCVLGRVLVSYVLVCFREGLGQWFSSGWFLEGFWSVVALGITAAAFYL